MRGFLFGAALIAVAASAFAAAPSYDWHLPPGVAPPPVPADNPMSDAKVALGRRLFYDADLSLDGTTSCGTCHEPHRAFTEGNASHPGVGGVPGRRNVMALANVAYFEPLTWADSTQHHLETQMRVPVLGTHPVEMGMAGKEDDLARRLSTDSCYQQMFQAAFPQDRGRIDLSTIGKALASFERTLISYEAPYDRFRRGDINAVPEAARHGASLFSSLGCASCHTGNNFTDLKFHAVGAGTFPDRDRGLIEITGKNEDAGAIRTPSLRNVALTMPYLHDGSVKTLPEAVRRHAVVSDPDMADIVAFLQSLSDQNFVANPAFVLPRIACGKPNY